MARRVTGNDDVELSRRAEHALRTRKRHKLVGFSWWPQGASVYRLCLETGFEIGMLRREGESWMATFFGQTKKFNPRFSEETAKKNAFKWASQIVEQMGEMTLLPDATRTEVPIVR